MEPVTDNEQDISIQQCEPAGKGADARLRCRVLRGDTILGEFALARSASGWLPIPVPGGANEGLVHATAVEFARDVNEGRITLD